MIAKKRIYTKKKKKKNRQLNKSYRDVNCTSLRKQPTSCEVATCALAKRRLSNERKYSILMTRHYPDLGSASDWLKRVGTSFQPIRSTTKIWVVMRHQYGISALVTQTSFCEGSSGDLAKCRLFSQAIIALKMLQSNAGLYE